MPRYIDADSAINDLCGSQCGCTINECGLEEPCEKARCILKQPTADVQEVKHGHWEFYGKLGNIREYFCSECNEVISSNKPPYCESCGAKMDGKE